MLDADSYYFFDREVCANVKIKAIHSGYFLSRGKKDLRIFIWTTLISKISHATLSVGGEWGRS